MRIAAFGGDFNADQSDEGEDASIGSFNSSSQSAFLASFPSQGSTSSQSTPLDILITHMWPANITEDISKPPEVSNAINLGTSAISEILQTTRPRYHFVSEHSLFWERSPFEWPDATDSRQFTRFISLGEFDNALKYRWFYAFSLQSSDKTSIQTVPPNLTPNPYVRQLNKPAKRSIPHEDGTNYIFEGGTAKRSRYGNSWPEILRLV